MHRMLSVACVLQSTKDCPANNVLMATLVAAPMVDLIQLVYPAIVITILTLVTLRLASASIVHTIPQVIIVRGAPMVGMATRLAAQLQTVGHAPVREDRTHLISLPAHAFLTRMVYLPARIAHWGTVIDTVMFARMVTLGALGNSAAGVASVNVITIQIPLLDETVTSSLGNALTVCTTRLGLIVNGARLNSMETLWTRPALHATVPWRVHLAMFAIT